MMRKTPLRRFSFFDVNMETSKSPHGPPRGIVNKYISLGLPPWAAWVNTYDSHARYRMSATTNHGFLPKQFHEVDGIWLNERVRERVRASRVKTYVSRQLKYPWMRIGVWHSDLLNHWVQIPHVHAAQYAIERDGGFDNFILKRSGSELKSKYGERLRRHLLVRQGEIRKNFILEKHVEALSDHIAKQSHAANSTAALDDVLQAFGVEGGSLRIVNSTLAVKAKRRMDDAQKRKLLRKQIEKEKKVKTTA